MSCTFAAPPGTEARIASISAWVSATSGTISGVIVSHPGTMVLGGT
jgi:hypothetical protein